MLELDSGFLFLHYKCDSDKPKTFIPFVSVKFLRNDVPSANLVCGYSFEGTDSYNFFEHDFSNQIPAVSKDGNHGATSNSFI